MGFATFINAKTVMNTKSYCFFCIGTGYLYKRTEFLQVTIRNACARFSKWELTR